MGGARDSQRLELCAATSTRSMSSSEHRRISGLKATLGSMVGRWVAYLLAIWLGRLTWLSLIVRLELLRMWPSGGSRAVSLPSTCFVWALVAGKPKATSDIYAHIFNKSQQIKTTNHRLKSRRLAIKLSARIRTMISFLCKQAKWSPSPRRFHTRKESKEGTQTRPLASSMISRSES